MGCCCHSKSAGDDDNCAKVIDAMKHAGEPLKVADIAEKAGMDKDECNKVIEQLKKDGKVHSPKRCFYSVVE
jgi:hypothetical protein